MSNREQRYTRYLLRDDDGTIIKQGKVLSLAKAKERNLLWNPDVQLIFKGHLVAKLGGMYVLIPRVEDGCLRDLEFLE